MSHTKRRSSSPPRWVWVTSGWNWAPNSRRRESAIAAIGALALLAASSKPGGSAVTRSPWLIHTSRLGPSPPNKASRSRNCTLAWPNSLWLEPATAPPSWAAIACIP